MALPPMLIDAPAAPPVQYGLFDVATGPTNNLPVHANSSGAIWESEACGQPHLYPAACVDVAYPAMTYDTDGGTTTAFVFNVYASEKCAVAGRTNAEAEGRVRTKLALNEQFAVEKALWGGGDGVTGIFQQMQALGSVTTLADTTTLTEGVALLEQKAAESYRGRAIIHARPRLQAYAASRNLVEGNAGIPGQKLTTRIGNYWSFGSGYSGVGPASEAVDATTEFMFITGRVLVWRSPEVFVTPGDQILNRTDNQRAIHAMRTYAVAVECVVAATQVTRA